MTRALFLTLLLATLAGCAGGYASSSACSGGHETSQACQNERYKSVP